MLPFKMLKKIHKFSIKYQVMIKSIGVQLICAFVFLFICKNGRIKYNYSI